MEKELEFEIPVPLKIGKIGVLFVGIYGFGRREEYEEISDYFVEI